MRAAAALLLAGAATAANPGCIPSCAAPTPPLGWRSWNTVATAVNDTYMRGAIDGLVLRRNTLWNGTGPVSLYDLGYIRAGIDDGWEDGGAGVNGSFHDAAGVALVRTDLFPDMRALAEYAHSRGVLIDGYRNNDGNCEDGKVGPYYENDAMQTAEWGFDGLKFDNCGPGRNLTLWAEALVATGRPMLVENCNDEFPFRPTVREDGTLDCPYNFYRTGSDNSPSFYTTVANLMQLNDYLNISRPNCFAYGDMLEVGAPAPSIPTHCNGTQRLTYNEALAHFNAWAVLSSPLILGLDLTNTTEYDMWWPIISNTEAIAINQAWAGEAGHLIAASTDMYEGPIYAGCLCEATRAPGSYPIPMWTVWGKTLPGGQFAAIAINTMLDRNAMTQVTSAQLGFPAGATLAVRDVAAHEDLPDIVGGVWNISLGPRGSQFLLFTPK